MAHATADEDAMDFQDPDYIRDNEGPPDVDIFDQVATVEEEDLPDDDSSLPVRHDNKMLVPSVSIWSGGVSSSFPHAIDVSSDYNDSSLAAINSIMSASTTVIRHLSITNSSVPLIDINRQQHLVNTHLQ